MTVNLKATLVEPGKGATYLALGDLYTFLATGEDTDGKYALVEMVLQPQSNTPQHINEEDEAHYILEGKVEYQLDERTITAIPGTYLYFPKGKGHGFKNIGSTTAKVLMWVTPPGGEQFYAEIGQLVNLLMSEKEKRNLSVPPSPADIEKFVELALTKYKVKLVPPTL
ncbi:cupin 2 domain-containing protein [Stanieria sp. NIES-3757]|nr:cupin 2 domain-containing protein [Stanieria sp. NIES-3757]